MIYYYLLHTHFTFSFSLLKLNKWIPSLNAWHSCLLLRDSINKFIQFLYWNFELLEPNHMKIRGTEFSIKTIFMVADCDIEKKRGSFFSLSTLWICLHIHNLRNRFKSTLMDISLFVSLDYDFIVYLYIMEYINN